MLLDHAKFAELLKDIARINAEDSSRYNVNGMKLLSENDLMQ